MTEDLTKIPQIPCKKEKKKNHCGVHLRPCKKNLYHVLIAYDPKAVPVALL